MVVDGDDLSAKISEDRSAVTGVRTGPIESVEVSGVSGGPGVSGGTAALSIT